MKNLSNYSLTTWRHTWIAIALFWSAVTCATATNGPETTQPDCQCPQVTGVSVSSSALSMTVSWDANATFTSYLVQVFKPGATGVYFEATSTGNSTVIHGTSPATTYLVKVFGICGDHQAAATTVNHTTVPTPPGNCFPGDVPGTEAAAQPLNGSSFSEQIDQEGDIDMYYFDWTADCRGITRVITLSSMSNDYELEVHYLDNTGKAVSQVSTNPGTTPESISLTLPPEIMLPKRIFIQVMGATSYSYNSYDCYLLSGPFGPCSFAPGGGGENLVNNGNSGIIARVNQNSNLLEVEFTDGFAKDQMVNLELFSLQGQLLHTENMSVTKGQDKIELDIPNLSSGMYLLNAEGDFGQKSAKLVIAN